MNIIPIPIPVIEPKKQWEVVELAVKADSYDEPDIHSQFLSKKNRLKNPTSRKSQRKYPFYDMEEGDRVLIVDGHRGCSPLYSVRQITKRYGIRYTTKQTHSGIIVTCVYRPEDME